MEDLFLDDVDFLKIINLLNSLSNDKNIKADNVTRSFLFSIEDKRELDIAKECLFCLSRYMINNSNMLNEYQKTTKSEVDNIRFSVYDPISRVKCILVLSFDYKESRQLKYIDWYENNMFIIKTCCSDEWIINDFNSLEYFINNYLVKFSSINTLE